MRYKNISDQQQTVIGVGEVGPGGSIETLEPINNPNFEQVAADDKQQPAKKGGK